MKILLGYSHYRSPKDIGKWLRDWAGRLRHAGIDIELFCLTIDPPAPRLSWTSLATAWESGDRKLFDLYEELLEKSQDFDVFINWNGINLHPEFVDLLPLTKVYGCFDDPESSEDLSRPVALHYDLCLVGNIAEVDTYRQWGVENAEYWPLGFFATDADPTITEDQIKSDERDEELSLLCERVSGWRSERLEKFAVAFPRGQYFGRGWPNGYIEESDKLGLYRRTKIGPNFHNSTGPINLRTFMLPANGVMLLCDNKSHLAKLFKLGEEAVGFDNIDEAIELCNFYLEHEEERKRIAVAGWKRARRDYNEVACFSTGLKHIAKVHVRRETPPVQAQTSRLRRIRLINFCKYYFVAFPFRIAPVKLWSRSFEKRRHGKS